LRQQVASGTSAFGVLNIPKTFSQTNSIQEYVCLGFPKLPPEEIGRREGAEPEGIYMMKENERFYPKRDLAAHVLGFVDLDEKGQGGIEHALDKQISQQGRKDSGDGGCAPALV